VIVVDNGPGEGLPSAVEGAHPDLVILPSHENPGFGAGCNLGADAAFREGADGVWFLNNDAVIEAPLLEEFVSLSRHHPEVAIWAHTQCEGGRRIGADHHAAWFAVSQPDFPPPPAGCRFLGPSESLSGASMFIPKWQWERVGPWPSDYFLYYEDAALCHRAHRHGLPIALLDKFVLHERGTTTGRRYSLTVFYGTRNRLLLHQQIHPERRLSRLLMSLNALQKRFFQGKWRLLKPTLDGLFAALTGRRGRDSRY